MHRRRPAAALADRYLPGTGDNFVSNEVVVRGITAAQVWRYLTSTSTWESYYDNVAAISFPDGDGPELKADVMFRFGTFGFARQDGRPEERLDVLHAWLVEDLPGGRARVLTQETQIGTPAAALAQERPNLMLNGHQARLDGLVAAASE